MVYWILCSMVYLVLCNSIYDMAKSALDEMESLETLTYNEFLLKNGYLYLADSEPDDSLSQKCPNGTAFQKLRPRQKETI